MYKREEAEQAIRRLATDWVEDTNFRRQIGHYPSFIEFHAWANTKGYGGYFNFRSKIGAGIDAEDWFDSEIKRSWRWTTPMPSGSAEQ